MLFDELKTDLGIHGQEKPKPYSPLFKDRFRDNSLLTAMERAFVIDIQNVADYLLNANWKTMWNYSDFPNVAPPFPDVWMEYQVKDPKGSGLHKSGVLLSSVDLYQEDPEMRRNAVQFFGLSPIESEVMTNPDFGGRWRWVVRSTAFKRIYSGEIIEMGSMWWLINKDGQLVDPKLNKFTFSDAAIQLTKAMGDDLVTVRDYLKSVNFPVMLALTFSHCRNTRIEKREPISESLQRARMKRGKPRLTRPHTIVIDPIKKAIQEGTGHDHYTQGAKTLHIVRGHFKTYTEDSPLFGRYKGTFWFPMHTAGTSGSAPRNEYKVKTGENE